MYACHVTLFPFPNSLSGAILGHPGVFLDQPEVILVSELSLSLGEQVAMRWMSRQLCGIGNRE